MKKIAILLVAASTLAGCNLGMAPSGGDTAQVEANFKAMSPKERIQTIKLSPASPERKAQLIQDIEKETGYHDGSDAVVAGGSQSHPSPGATPGPGQ